MTTPNLVPMPRYMPIAPTRTASELVLRSVEITGTGTYNCALKPYSLQRDLGPFSFLWIAPLVLTCDNSRQMCFSSAGARSRFVRSMANSNAAVAVSLGIIPLATKQSAKSSLDKEILCGLFTFAGYITLP